MTSPATSRLVALEGVGNFRDFGGYETASGRLRLGRLFRSAHLAHASDADLAVLEGYGIRAVVDLRRAVERAVEPCRRWNGFGAEVIENDIEEAFLQPSPTPNQGFPMHLDVEAHRARSRGFYARAAYEERHIDLFRRYFQALVAPDDGPVLIHCASGKDRTGLLAALTHWAVGVREGDLMGDFLATNALLGPRLPGLRKLANAAAGREVADDELLSRVSVGPDYLEAAFGSMIERNGSVDGYLRDVLGLDAGRKTALIDRLVA